MTNTNSAEDLDLQKSRHIRNQFFNNSSEKTEIFGWIDYPAPSTKQNRSVHFVSVDFFNEYMYMLPVWEKPRRKMLLSQTKTF